MTAVACVGLSVRDLIFSVESLPAGPGKSHAIDRVEVGGGPASNAAVTVSSLGGDARLISVVGDDGLGAAITSELADLGVDTSHVRVVESLRSPISVVTVDVNGERAIVNHTDQRLFDAASPPGEGDLRGAEAVLVDIRWHRGAVAALQWAASRGVPGIVDFDVGWGEAGPILASASHLLFSADALRDLTGQSDLEQGLTSVAKETGAWLGVTDGENGAMWLDSGVVRRFPAFEVDVVDTTGAGDVFHGAFALEVAAGRGHEEAIRVAAAASALTCAQFGGRSGIPGREQVAAFLEERE